MEFLLISSPDLGQTKLPLELQLSDCPLLSPTGHPLKFYKFDGLFLAATLLQSNDICAAAFDGSAFDYRQAYHADHWPSLPACISYLDGCMDEENNSVLKGAFSLVRVNPHTKAFTITNDPMSLYPLFVCAFGTTLIVSNNIYLIEGAVQSFGATLTRSCRGLAISFLFNCGSQDRTGFREVSLLPAGKVITGVGPNWRIINKAPTATNLQDSKPPFDDALGRVKRNIENCAKVAELTQLNNFSGAHTTRSLISSALSQTSSDFVPLSADDWEDAVKIRQGTVFAPTTHFSPASDSHKMVAYDAFLDAAKLKPRPAPPKGAFFFSSPLSNMTKLSNSDPIYSAALSGYHKRSSKHAARWTLTMAEQSSAFHSIFRRSFLRQTATKLLKELERETLDSQALRQRFYNRYDNRQAGFEMRLQNIKVPTMAPFADPWLSSRSLPKELVPGKSSGKKDTRPIEKTYEEGQVSKQWDACNEAALNLATDLSLSSDVWEFLDRRKTLAALGKQGSFNKTDQQAEKALQLYQLFLWAAGS